MVPQPLPTKTLAPQTSFACTPFSPFATYGQEGFKPARPILFIRLFFLFFWLRWDFATFRFDALQLLKTIHD
jgi:hypothetical protein